MEENGDVVIPTDKEVLAAWMENNWRQKRYLLTKFVYVDHPLDKYYT